MTEKKIKELKLRVDMTIYPLEAIQAAAYTLTHRAHVRMARKAKNGMMVRLKPKTNSSSVPTLTDEFHDELLHETLRLKVSQSNQKIREYIVTKALVSAQVPSVLPPAAPAAGESRESCPECEAQAKAAPVDAELEKEIEKLLSEIEKSGSTNDDPLGVAVPWEKKYGAKAGGARRKGKKAS